MLRQITGINHRFAKLLLEKNCNVVIADLSLRPEAQKLVDDYTTQPRAVFVKTDVVKWDDLTNMFDVADKEFGGADIVCPPLYPSRADPKTNNDRYVRVLESLSLTGPTFGIRRELQSQKIVFMAQTELVTMPVSTSTSLILSALPSLLSLAG